MLSYADAPKRRGAGALRACCWTQGGLVAAGTLAVVVPEAMSKLCGDGRSGVWSAGAGATDCGVMRAVVEICSREDITNSGRPATRGGRVGVFAGRGWP